jgi:hypothetical protein
MATTTRITKEKHRMSENEGTSWMVTLPGEEPRPATKWEVARLMVRMRRGNYDALFRAVGWEPVPISVPPKNDL